MAQIWYLPAFFLIGACSVSAVPGSIFGGPLGDLILLLFSPSFSILILKAFSIFSFGLVLLASSSSVFSFMSYFIFVSSKYSFQPPGVYWLMISSIKLLLFFRVFLPWIFCFCHRWFLCRAALFLYIVLPFGVDVGTIRIIFMMLSSIWFSFLPEASFGLRVLSSPASVCVCVRVCVCVSLCVNHLLVRAITRDPFKLG